jgi:hypothetical protein
MARGETQKKLVIINIISFSFSGSTWLNLLLGAHSEMFSVGEVWYIRPPEGAICKMHGKECPIWSQFDINSTENIYLQISRLTGKQFLVVSNPRRFLRFQQHPDIEAKYIHLIRDGRAVTASMLRKKPELSMWRAARTWSKTVRRRQKFIARQNPTHTIRVFYEKILADKEKELRRLCEFIGVSFQASMLDLEILDPHFIGGNVGTLYSIARQKGTDLPSAALPKGPKRHWPDTQFYERADPRNFVDERWKEELTDWQLFTFALIAGYTNRRYKYPASFDRD